MEKRKIYSNQQRISALKFVKAILEELNEHTEVSGRDLQKAVEKAMPNLNLKGAVFYQRMQYFDDHCCNLFTHESRKGYIGDYEVQERVYTITDNGRTQLAIFGNAIEDAIQRGEPPDNIVTSFLR